MAGREVTGQKIAIVGAGLSGAAIAFVLKSHNFHNITVFDERPHVAGNVHTERCAATGVMLHKYGPHIFHTDDTEVWQWFDRFADLQPHIQRTKAVAYGETYSFPINLHTLNQFWREDYTPAEAKEQLAACARAGLLSLGGVPPETNFETYGRSLVGVQLYRAFIENYTTKQWGRKPSELPASILKRLPIRFSYDDNVFNHKHQGIPRYGYTDAVERMLSGITVRKSYKFTRADAAHFDHVFYTGPLDEWFDYSAGPLAYRTLDLERTVYTGVEDQQGCSVLNNCDLETLWTRRTEHKHFTPWEKSAVEGTTITEEHPREWRQGDIRYYPVRLAQDKVALAKYEEMAAQDRGTTYVGRLATYRYLDMDQCLREAIDAARKFALSTGRRSLAGI